MQTYSGGIRENGFELKEGIFRVGIKINFFFIKHVFIVFIKIFF